MGYLFLSIALIVGTAKGYCGKKTSSAIETKTDSMILNLFRMILCILIGFLLTVWQNGFATLLPNTAILLISALSGIATSMFVICWLLSVRTGSYMMVEVFLLLGVTVPIVLCRVLFSEKIAALQVVGIAVLLIAIYIMTAYNSSVKGKMNFTAFLLLLLCGFSNGMVDFSQKLFVKIVPQGSIAVFNFYTYIFSALTLAIVYYVFRATDTREGENVRKPIVVIKSSWYFIVIMAVCLFANSFFKTQAAQYLDAVLLYPLSQGCAVILSLLMAAVFFKEKITVKCVAGIFLSFVALLMINFG
ncbi:MAG: EamA family transporter [Acutalibacteraceae bacterium]|nr:EamA family transporter [Acutalibacteraceae bacterium]